MCLCFATHMSIFIAQFRVGYIYTYYLIFKMFKNTNHEENFLGAKTPPVSLTGHDAASLRQDSQGSSWVSMFSLVSRPALSLLQKVLPGRPRTPALSDSISFPSGEFKQNLIDAESVFLGQLDNIIPTTQHSTQMAYPHCQHECATGLKPDYALTFNWLTVDSLREFGFENAADMDLKSQPQTSIGYLETVRSLLSQVALNADSAQELRQTETGQLIAGKTRSSAGTSPSKSASNWWGGFWGNENKSQSWLSNLSWSKEATETSAQHSSRHYIQSEIGTKAAVAKPTELFVQWNNVESMHVQSSGPPRHKGKLRNNGNLQTTPPESLQSLQGLPLEPLPFTVISNQLANVGADTASTEVAVLTPDQDNGYSSLEEEHTTSRHNMVKMNGDSISLATMSAGDREGEEVEQGQQGKNAAPGDMDREEEQERVNSDLSESDDEEEPLSPAGPHAYPTPSCQNRAIAYIMGSTCSDDGQSDDTLSEDEKDDDGFDSEGCSDSSDSDGLDKENDDQEEGSDLEHAEAERLWNSLCKNNDPYNLHNFTATIRSSSSPPAASPPRTIPPPTSSSATCSPHASPLSPSPLSPPASPPSLAPLESWDESSASEMDDAESLHLWNSFTATSDPYSPLNFQAPLRTCVSCKGEGSQVRKSRSSTRHSQLSSPQDKTSEAEETQDSGFSETQGNILPATTITSHCCVALKKVRFCDQVEEFYSGPEDRRSPWEQLARDRCRFLRRVQEVEEAIGYVLMPASRLLAYQKLGLQHQHEQS